MSDDPLRDLVLAFARHRITRREDRIRLCIDHAGRHLTSSADMTPVEVDVLLARLARLPAGTDLLAVVARLHRQEQANAAEAASRSRTTRDDPRRVLTPQEVAERLDVLHAAGLLAAPHQWPEADRRAAEPPGYSAGVLELGYEGDG